MNSIVANLREITISELFSGIITPLVIFIAGVAVSYSSYLFKKWEHKQLMKKVITAWLIALRRQCAWAIENINNIITAFKEDNELPAEGFIYISLDRFMNISDEDLMLILEDGNTYTVLMTMAEAIKSLHLEYDKDYKQMIEYRNANELFDPESLALHIFNLQQFINAANKYLGEPKEESLQTKRLSKII